MAKTQSKHKLKTNTCLTASFFPRQPE